MLNKQVKSRLFEITKELKEISIKNKLSFYINTNPYINDVSTINVFDVKGHALNKEWEWIETDKEKASEIELTIYAMETKEVAAV